jgi:hypothetical protein
MSGTTTPSSFDAAHLTSAARKSGKKRMKFGFAPMREG